ncbi:hypothetical protein [Streptomyces sp. NPDC002324]
MDETLEHVAAGRGISFLARSASVFSSHPNVVHVPIPDMAPAQVCLAVAASHTSPVHTGDDGTTARSLSLQAHAWAAAPVRAAAHVSRVQAALIDESRRDSPDGGGTPLHHREGAVLPGGVSGW